MAEKGTFSGNGETSSGPSGTHTVKLDLDGLYSEIMRDNSGSVPLDRKNLGLETKESPLSTLTKKAPHKYIFRKSIGQGGMKVVMQVRDRDTARDVAMALLPDAESRPKQEILRFVEEARITATLEHPNIVPVHDIGIDSAGSPYFTMKLLHGETLASALKKLESQDPVYLAKYPLDRLLRIFVKICNGIAFAHSKGVLHLDLKPENIQIGDYGEVIIMDWGLARILAEKNDVIQEKADLSESVKNSLLEKKGITLDGIRKGTPGYMAPEQAAGRNSEKDFRTDIYALGAILYSILTHVNPIPHQDVRNMLADTVNGNIIPPKQRAPGKIIPTALEAVVLKAMSLKSADRYQTVQELRNEVNSFISGYATKAEKATLVKQTLLFYRRHRISFNSILIALILGFSASVYAVLEYARQTGDWILAFDGNFTKPETELSGIMFNSGTLSGHVSPWKMTEDGLEMNKGEWMILPDLGTQNNIRVSAEIVFPQKPGILELCLSACPEPLQDALQMPAGYTFQLAAYAGTLDSIYKTERAGSSDLFAAADSNFLRGKVNKILFERLDGTLSVRENGKTVLSISDLFPITGKEYRRVFLRTDASGVRIRRIAVYRLALPKKSSPVIAGDALFDSRHYEDAIEKYLMIADDYQKGPIAELALAKAYMTAAAKIAKIEKRNAYLLGIKNRISSRFSSFRYRESILELDVLMLWKNRQYKDAQILIEDLFAANPRTGIIKRVLNQPHLPLPKEVQEILLDHIARTVNLNCLNVSGMGLSSLSRLSGMKLTYLDCSGNNLTGLEGLERMPLEVLLCSGNRITGLEALSGNRTLRTLSCDANQIRDLSPLQNTRISELNCSENRIVSLEKLENLPVQQLNARENLISDLSPLRGMVLTKLDLGQNPVSDLSPLAGLPLETLKIDQTKISSISALSGMPLTVLALWGNPALKDLSPLETLSQLEILSIPSGVPVPKGLAAMERLQYITDSGILPSSDQDAAGYFSQHQIPRAGHSTVQPKVLMKDF